MPKKIDNKKQGFFRQIYECASIYNLKFEDDNLKVIFKSFDVI